MEVDRSTKSTDDKADRSTKGSRKKHIVDGGNAGKSQCKQERLQQAVHRIGPNSSLSLVAHPRDAATTGVCWSFSDTGTSLCWDNLVSTNPDPMEHARILHG
jgi:hypothetical protein